MCCLQYRIRALEREGETSGQKETFYSLSIKTPWPGYDYLPPSSRVNSEGHVDKATFVPINCDTFPELRGRADHMEQGWLSSRDKPMIQNDISKLVQFGSNNSIKFIRTIFYGQEDNS